MESAQVKGNFDELKLPTATKKFSVRVKPEVRREQKIDWVNKPITNQRGGRPRANDIIPNKPGVIGVAAKKLLVF